MKLSLKPVNGGPFNCRPANEIELEDSEILCNNVILPEEFNPHNVRLFVIGNEFGPLFAVWAEHEQEALDEGVDSNKMDSFAVAPEDDTEENEHAHLGNASEPFDLTYCWIQQVDLSPASNWKLLCKFAEARGAAKDNLYL